MKKLSDYLTVGAAASYLGVSKDTLRRWDAAGKLKARRHPVTGFRLYLQEDLDAVLGGVGEPGGEQGNRRRPANKAGKGKRR